MRRRSPQRGLVKSSTFSVSLNGGRAPLMAQLMADAFILIIPQKPRHSPQPGARLPSLSPPTLAPLNPNGCPTLYSTTLFPPRPPHHTAKPPRCHELLSLIGRGTSSPRSKNCSFPVPWGPRVQSVLSHDDVRRALDKGCLQAQPKFRSRPEVSTEPFHRACATTREHRPNRAVAGKGESKKPGRLEGSRMYSKACVSASTLTWRVLPTPGLRFGVLSQLCPKPMKPSTQFLAKLAEDLNAPYSRAELKRACCLKLRHKAA